MLVRIHFVTIRFKKRASRMRKGRHHLRIQDMLSCMLVKYASFKTLVDEKKKLFCSSDRRECSTRHLQKIKQEKTLSESSFLTIIFRLLRPSLFSEIEVYIYIYIYI